MAVTHESYDSYLLSRAIEDPSVDFSAATVRVAILGSGYTPDLAVDAFWDDISAEEIIAVGYIAGGKALTSVTEAIEATGHFAYVFADPVAWPSFTSVDIRYAVVYIDTGTPSTSPLVTLIDFDGVQEIGGGTFTIVFQQPVDGGMITFRRAA